MQNWAQYKEIYSMKNDNLSKIGSPNVSSEGLQNQINEFADTVKHIGDDASEYASEFYTKATQWLEENRSTAITTAAVFAVVGIAAYFLTRSSSSTESNKSSHAA